MDGQERSKHDDVEWPTAAEDLQSIYGESFLASKGFKRDRIALYLAFSHLASLFLGPLCGIMTDHMLVYALDSFLFHNNHIFCQLMHTFLILLHYTLRNCASPFGSVYYVCHSQMNEVYKDVFYQICLSESEQTNVRIKRSSILSAR